MPNTRLVMNRRAVEFYLKGGGGVSEALAAKANAIKAAADANSGRAGDYAVDSAVGRRRIRYAVHTNSWNGRWREARERALSRAMNSGRG